MTDEDYTLNITLQALRAEVDLTSISNLYRRTTDFGQQLYTDAIFETLLMADYGDTNYSVFANNSNTITIGTTEYVKLTAYLYDVYDTDGNQLLLNDGILYKLVDNVPESTNVLVIDEVLTAVYSEANLYGNTEQYNQYNTLYPIYTDQLLQSTVDADIGGSTEAIMIDISDTIEISDITYQKLKVSYNDESYYVYNSNGKQLVAYPQGIGYPQGGSWTIHYIDNGSVSEEIGQVVETV